MYCSITLAFREILSEKCSMMASRMPVAYWGFVSLFSSDVTMTAGSVDVTRLRRRRRTGAALLSFFAGSEADLGRPKNSAVLPKVVAIVAKAGLGIGFGGDSDSCWAWAWASSCWASRSFSSHLSDSLWRTWCSSGRRACRAVIFLTSITVDGFDDWISTTGSNPAPCWSCEEEGVAVGQATNMVGGVGGANDHTTQGLPVRKTHRDDPLDHQVRGILELHHIIGIPGSLTLV